MSLAAWIGGPGPLLVLVFALALDGLLPPAPGFFKHLPHPVRALGWLIGLLDRKLNRPQRGEADRLVRGALAALFVVALAGGAGWALAAVARALPFGWIWELLAVVSLLAQRSLFDHARAVLRPLEAGDLAGARGAVGHLVGRDPDSLDRRECPTRRFSSLLDMCIAFWSRGP